MFLRASGPGADRLGTSGRLIEDVDATAAPPSAAVTAPVDPSALLLPAIPGAALVLPPAPPFAPSGVPSPAVVLFGWPGRFAKGGFVIAGVETIGLFAKPEESVGRPDGKDSGLYVGIGIESGIVNGIAG